MIFEQGPEEGEGVSSERRLPKGRLFLAAGAAETKPKEGTVTDRLQVEQGSQSAGVEIAGEGRSLEMGRTEWKEEGRSEGGVVSHCKDLSFSSE